MNEEQLRLPRVRQTADDAYAGTLQDLLERGDVSRQGTSRSVGSDKETREILNYSMVITSPRERLVFNNKKRLNLPAAVARFVWMMAASDRLADIAFYEDKSRKFSDNGISIPGSSYGQRILSPRPGLNQLESVIRRLKADLGSRRAAISIYQAEDAVRDSSDIPCTFGLFYLVRKGRLHATTLMRSNNAFLLLPYNIFEFSFLAEVVAAELEIPLGPLTHHAISMHVYDHEYEKAREVVAEWADPSAASTLLPVPAMPVRPSPLEQIRLLAILEAELRHGSAGLKETNVEDWIDKGGEALHPFWRQLYFLLMLHVAKRNGDQGALGALESVIVDPWRTYLPESIFTTQPKDVRVPAVALVAEPGEAPQSKFVPFYSTRAIQSLKTRATEWERRKRQKLDWTQYARAQEVLLERLAARGGESFDDEISADEFDLTMKAVSSGDE
jgi:thymidylate synthase